MNLQHAIVRHQDRVNSATVLALQSFPAEVGVGLRQTTKLRSGMNLLIEDFKLKQDLVEKVEEENSQLEFCFCVAGGLSCQVQGVKNNLLLEQGQSNIYFVPDPKGVMCYRAGQQMIFINIRIQPSVFNHLFRDCFDRIPAPLHGIAQGKKAIYCQPGKMTPSMQMVIHQMLNCSFSGAMKQLYLESKAIELLLHQLSELTRQQKGPVSKVFVLNKKDADRVHDVRDILLHNLQDPPSLLGLARQAGLNDYKLKVGFRQEFGTTVFDYLRQLRMEKARLLFEEGHLNVAEVSTTIGYSNPSHFTALFKKHFGVNPSSFLAESRNKKYSTG